MLNKLRSNWHTNIHDANESSSRFLILPWLKIQNLASHVIGMVLKRLPGEWEEAYQTRPVLGETFVDSDRFEWTWEESEEEAEAD